MNPIENASMQPSNRATRRFLRRYWRSAKAMAAVEFAMIAPVLITLFFGMADISDALTASTKVTAVASTAADLVAQEKSICDPEMKDIFAALNAIMFPYPSTNMKIVISSLIDAGNGNTKVAWSNAQNTASRAVNSVVPVPSGLVDPGGSVIFAEVNYSYASATGHLIYGSIPLADKFYLHPRRTAQIGRTAGC